MVHFFGEVQGENRFHISLSGSKESGIQAYIRGWDIGIRISGNYSQEDVFDVYLTGGSNHPEKEIHIGSYTKNNLK